MRKIEKDDSVIVNGPRFPRSNILEVDEKDQKLKWLFSMVIPGWTNG